MSADGSYSGLWADGEHKFRLPIGLLRELQDKCKAGPPLIFQRLRLNVWEVDDIRETIRLGLIGGGMKPTEALVLVIRYIDEPLRLMDNVPVALEVLGAALVGVPGDQPGKAGLGEHSSMETTDGSSSPSFMAPEPSSDGMPEPLTV